MVSDFGKVLDPVADKLTQAALLFCLTSRYSWMWALLILFVVKELFMILLGCVLGFLPPVITFPIMGMSITDIHSPQFIIVASIEIIFAVGSIALTLIIGKKTMKESGQKSKENTEAKS